MFLNHLRYETFCSNLSPTNNLDVTSRYYYDEPDRNIQKDVFVMKMDIYEGIEMIKKYNINPDVILIDFEKKKDRLLKIIKKLKSYFPNASIIGDDYGAPSVRLAIKELRNSNLLIYTLQGSYFIGNSKSTYNEIIKRIKYQQHKNKLSKLQTKVLEDIKDKVLYNPFVKLPSQRSFSINEFVATNKDLGAKIVTTILNSEPLYDYPRPLHNPASITFFDYFFSKYDLFE